MAVRTVMDDGVAELVLDLPPVNQFSRALLGEVRDAMAGLPVDTRAVVVSSAVAGIFAAGGDLSYLLDHDIDDQVDYVRLCQEVYAAFEDTPLPTVAGIDGACIGGGLGLALGCDVRIAAEEAVLALPEVHLGILAGGGTVHRLVRTVGQGVARDLLLSGRRVTGREALGWGLVSRTTTAGGAAPAARALAREWADGSPEAIAATKRLTVAASEVTAGDGLAAELTAWRDVRLGANAQEGLVAFAEKRRPRFRTVQRSRRGPVRPAAPPGPGPAADPPPPRS